ncbi:MAG: hypothetical protein ACR2MX_15475 [Cyclobacteriaceae bacterium]
MSKLGEILNRYFKFEQQDFQKNWKLMLLCFLGATIFWFFKALNKEDYTATISYPVTFQYGSQDSLVLVEELPREIEINVSGGGWPLFRKTLGFSKQPLEVTLDQPTKTPYVLGSSLLGSVIQQVRPLRVNGIVTDTLKLHIEKKVIRKIPMLVDSLKIDLAPGFRIIGPVMIDEDTLTVIGPASLVNQLHDLHKIAIPILQIDENYDEFVSLEILDIPSFSYQPDKVRVRFAVGSFVQETQQIPVALRNFPDDSSVVLDRSQVTCSFYFPQQYLDSLSFFNLEAVADLSKMNPKDSTIIPELTRIPSYLQDVVLDKKPIKVTNAP